MPKLTEQFESRQSGIFVNEEKPWKTFNLPNRAEVKTFSHRQERRRARLDPETQPLYRKYYGCEF